MTFIINNIWFILFAAWGLPMSIYRSKFRKIVDRKSTRLNSSH